MSLLPIWVKPLAVALALAALAYVGWSVKATYAERDTLKTTVAAQEETLKLASKFTKVTSTVLSARVQSSTSIKQKAKNVQVEILRQLPTDPGGCSLPPAWRVLHDAAASNDEVPDASRGTDAETVPPQQAAITVTENYSICHDNADRLGKLQQWVRGVSE